MQNSYLTNIVNEFQRIKEDSIKIFGDLLQKQLNWKSAENKWSIGQCFDHIIITNKKYFPEFEELIKGNELKNSWKKIPFLPTFFGKLLLNILDPKKNIKMNAPKRLLPSNSNIDSDIINRFANHQDKLVKQIKELDQLDHQKIIVTSAVARFVTYSLKDTLTILSLHERKHFNQAERILKLENFPLD